jgi:hypothetical protein
VREEKHEEKYAGFEQGPIRPPSEARSLLIRVTRNCPWNRCAFCPVYKGSRFSVRPLAHVIRDIDAVHESIRLLETGDAPDRKMLAERAAAAPDRTAFEAAYMWHAAGMRPVFLQDANSLILKTDDLAAVLAHLRACFPEITRVTSYVRSQTIARKGDGEMARLRTAGLNRIHIGMESGSDAVLELMRKGVTKAGHIEAGRRVRGAGIELSEYWMPGLGGRDLWEEHARESADTLNRINPDYIRLRSLAIPAGTPLSELRASGRFTECTGVQTVREIRLFLSLLEGVSSRIRSDHILNLFGEVEGKLPEDREKMLAVLDRFLALSPEDQCVYQIGRRTGRLQRLEDLEDPDRRAAAETLCRQLDATPETVDAVIAEITRRFI